MQTGKWMRKRWAKVKGKEKLKKLAVPAGVTAAGATLGVVVAKQLGRLPNVRAQLGSAQVRGGTKDGGQSGTNSRRGLDSSELKARQQRRAKHREQRRQKIKT